MKVVLPIFYETDETEMKEMIGKGVNLDDYEVRQVVFYTDSIAIAEHKNDEGNIEGSTIYFSGHSFCSPLDKESIEELIDISLKK